MNKTDAVKKGVELMKKNPSDNHQPPKKDVITATELEDLIENLQIQLNSYLQVVNENQTRAVETQGALRLATAQLQGLKNDTESTD